MSTTRINIFLTGATGYIGGSILTALLQHSNASHFNITALIRGDDERVRKLASLNVTPLVGSNESFEMIENIASESHVVIHTANSSDAGADPGLLDISDLSFGAWDQHETYAR
jgi:thioester reductase-like protein